jgi:hypothetical protein
MPRYRVTRTRSESYLIDADTEEEAVHETVSGRRYRNPRLEEEGASNMVTVEELAEEPAYAPL